MVQVCIKATATRSARNQRNAPKEGKPARLTFTRLWGALNPQLIKPGTECRSGDQLMGIPPSVHDCAAKVMANGGTFFIYGTGYLSRPLLPGEHEISAMPRRVGFESAAHQVGCRMSLRGPIHGTSVQRTHLRRGGDGQRWHLIHLWHRWEARQVLPGEHEISAMPRRVGNRLFQLLFSQVAPDD